MKKKRLTNLLKFGILLFGFSLLLWNCEKDEILLENPTESDLVKEKIEAVALEELPENLLDKVFSVSKKASFKSSSKLFSKQLLTTYFEPSANVVTTETGFTTYSLIIKKDVDINRFLHKNIVSKKSYRNQCSEPSGGGNSSSFDVIALNSSGSIGGSSSNIGNPIHVSFNNINSGILGVTFTNINTGITTTNYTNLNNTGNWNIFNGIWTGISNATTGVWNGIKGIGSWIGGLFKSNRTSKCPGSLSRGDDGDKDKEECTGQIAAEQDAKLMSLNEFENKHLLDKNEALDIPLPKEFFETKAFQNKNLIAITAEDFDCACEKDKSFTIAQFLELEFDQMLFLAEDGQKTLRYKICKFIKENNHSDKAKNFAKFTIKNNSTKYINENFGFTKKSPFNVDVTQVLDSISLPTNDSTKIANKKFLCLYKKLTTSNSYKNLFTNIFGGNQDVLNAKFKITKNLKNSNGEIKNGLRTVLPGGTRVNGVITNFNVLIEIDQRLLNEGSSYDATKTILHESIHAYLTLKKLNCGQFSSFDQYNNDDIQETIKTYYNNFNCNGTQGQHEFMFDYMLPTFKTVFEEIGMLNFMTQGNINGLATYDVQNTPISNLNITSSHSFKWEEFHLYNSLKGLHETESFINRIQNDIEKNKLYRAYRYLGQIYLEKDCN